MTAFHYAIARCRHARVRDEHRNVAVLLLSPSERRVWLHRGDLRARAYLVGDAADFVSVLLDALEDQARDAVRGGDAAEVHEWLRARALPTEDGLSLSPPAVGIAPDLEQEVARLARLYLGEGQPEAK